MRSRVRGKALSARINRNENICLNLNDKNNKYITKLSNKFLDIILIKCTYLYKSPFNRVLLKCKAKAFCILRICQS